MLNCAVQVYSHRIVGIAVIQVATPWRTGRSPVRRDRNRSSACRVEFDERLLRAFDIVGEIDQIIVTEGFLLSGDLRGLNLFGRSAAPLARSSGLPIRVLTSLFNKPVFMRSAAMALVSSVILPAGTNLVQWRGIHASPPSDQGWRRACR